MKCIIVDDDNNCIKALSGIIREYLPQLEITGTAQNIAAAVRLINAGEPDVVFLDVEIQSELGFDLFRFIPEPRFDVVFTTAHEKYAMKAIKSSCFDYLLKPIDTGELVSTINRLEKEKDARLSGRERASVLLDNVTGNERKVRKLAIPTRDEMIFIAADTIMYLEGDAKYTTLVLQNGQKYVSSKNIGEFEELLDEQLFFRCHRSWIVNLDCVVKFLKTDNQLVLKDNTLIDVSTRKKDDFLKLFSRI